MIKSRLYPSYFHFNDGREMRSSERVKDNRGYPHPFPALQFPSYLGEKLIYIISVLPYITLDNIFLLKFED